MKKILFAAALMVGAWVALESTASAQNVVIVGNTRGYYHPPANCAPGYRGGYYGGQNYHHGYHSPYYRSPGYGGYGNGHYNGLRNYSSYYNQPYYSGPGGSWGFSFYGN